MNTNSEKLDLAEIDRVELADRLIKEAEIQNFGRLLQLLINLFSKKKYLKKLAKREGQEVQLNFPAYDLDVNCLTFVLSENPSDPLTRPSENPITSITFNAGKAELIPTLIEIIKTKYNVFGVFKLLFKYLLKGKIKYKGSFRATLAVLRCFLIGNHEMYKKKREIK